MVSDSAQVLEAKNSVKFPKWLTDEFFEQILKEECDHNLKLKKWTIENASVKGESYSSHMYRAIVVVENIDEEISSKAYIIKAFPENDDKITEETVRCVGMFPKEIKMYEQIVPELESLLRETGDVEKFTPKCLKSARTPNPTDLLVMQDLSQMDYKMGNRFNGLDLKHTKLILKKLAKFHAASAQFVEHNGPYSDELLEGIFSQKIRKQFEDIYDGVLGLLINSIEQWSFGHKYAQKMRLWKPNFFAQIDSHMAVDEHEFNVLNHGDLWTNNNMYIYENEDPINVLFIDLQLSVYASPAIDLLYFIVSSCAKDIKVSNFDEFVQYYHENLTKVLKKLGYKKKIPSLLELQLSVMKRGFMAVIASLTVLPIALGESCDEATTENMQKGDDKAILYRKKLYANPKYVEIMEILLPFFDKKGWLDI